MDTPRLTNVFAGMPGRPPTGIAGDPGRFPPGGVARRVNAETRLLLGGPRALLMQLAHPMVAAGVADHSSFRDDPFARLWNTLDVTLTIGFGDRERSAAGVERVARTHARVRGTRGAATYHADDPELLAWVHATLVDSAIETYARFVGRFGAIARERYLHEMDPQARVFGVPEDRLWATYPDFRRFVATTVGSLPVGDEGRLLAEGVLAPRTPLSLVPTVALLRFVTAGLLPPALRDRFGLRWAARDERFLGALGAASRAGGTILPDALRRWPHAREADDRMRRA